jgi:CRISPR-associated protein Cmr1
MPHVFPQRQWPTVAEKILVGQQQNAIEAWNQVVSLLQHFRQGKNLGRNPGTDRPGRSRWPEPETIRRVTTRRSNLHSRMSHIPDDAFPRAELGLPIVFHFKDERQGDPPDTILYPENGQDGERRERMTSPLVVKPLALRDGRFMPIVLLLKAPVLAGVDLRSGKPEQSLNLPSPTHIRDQALSAYQNSPLAKSRNGCALEAFLANAISQGFQEVTR